MQLLIISMSYHGGLGNGTGGESVVFLVLEGPGSKPQVGALMAFASLSVLTIQVTQKVFVSFSLGKVERCGGGGSLDIPSS